MCFFYRHIRDTKQRHLFSIITGFALQFFMYRADVLIILALMLSNYVFMKVLDRRTLAPFLLIYNMAFLSILHIYYMLTAFGTWSLLVTTFLMPYVCRVSSLGFCYRDAMKENAEKLSKDQKERKIDVLPNLFELTSYTLYPGACIVGPFFEYNDYKMFIEQTGRYERIPYGRQEPIKKTLSGLFFLVLTLVITGYFTYNGCATEEFDNYSYWYKNVYYYLAMAGGRYKYYVAWYLTDAAIAVSGLSYNGRDENAKPKWDRVVSVYGFEIEVGTNARTMIDQWNHQTADWLRFYVFNRIRIAYPQFNFRATVLTFLMSAFWHGFYSTYYFSFFFGALLAEATKDVFKSKHAFKWIPAPISTVLCHIGSMQSLNFLGICFGLLTFDKAFKFGCSVYFLPPILCTLTVLILRVSPIGKMIRKSAPQRPAKDDKKPAEVKAADTKKAKAE